MPEHPTSVVSPMFSKELPAPPRLAWGWVFVLSFVTGGIFGAFWMLHISRWARRVHGVSNAHGWAYVFLIFSVLSNADDLNRWFAVSRPDEWFSGALAMGTFLLFLVVAFLLQGELEDAPIGLSLSGVMTFFFGPIYFQYHLQDFGGQRSGVAGAALNLSKESHPL